MTPRRSTTRNDPPSVRAITISIAVWWSPTVTRASPVATASDNPAMPSTAASRPISPLFSIPARNAINAL